MSSSSVVTASGHCQGRPVLRLGLCVGSGARERGRSSRSTVALLSCPLPSFVSQDGVRIHTIRRDTGKAHVWLLPLAFFANRDGNAYDTEGGRRGRLNTGVYTCRSPRTSNKCSTTPVPPMLLYICVTSPGVMGGLFHPLRRQRLRHRRWAGRGEAHRTMGPFARAVTPHILSTGALRSAVGASIERSQWAWDPSPPPAVSRLLPSERRTGNSAMNPLWAF